MLRDYKDECKIENKNMFEKKSIQGNIQKKIDTNASSDSKDTAIHTMKDDLAAIAGGVQYHAGFEAQKIISERKDNKTTPVQLKERESSPPISNNSPFFEQYSAQNISSQPISIGAENFSSGEKFENVQVQGKKGDDFKKIEPINLENKNNNLKKIFLMLVFALIIAIFAAGGYYFWLTRSGKNEVSNVSQSREDESGKQSVPEENMVEIETPKNKFSNDKPNYLRMDIENTDAKKIKQLLEQTAEDIKKENISMPIEFHVVDSNNNKVPFLVFALLANIQLPKTIFEQLDDTFSLYCHIDKNRSRLGVSITVKDKPKISSILKKEEANLHKYFQPIILAEIKNVNPVVYKDNQYNNHTIRYLNLDESNAGDVALDYVLAGQQLIIGTSKNSMWAILDKVNENAKSVSGQE